MVYDNLGELESEARSVAKEIKFYDMRTLELEDFEKNLKRFGIKGKRDLELINLIDEDWVRARGEAMAEELSAAVEGSEVAQSVYGENFRG